MIEAQRFISLVEQIATEEPKFRLGCCGDDGFCDAIGIVIGALLRAGGSWRGIHEINYAARKEVAKLALVSEGGLQKGELIFRAYEPWQGGYDLNMKYERNGDHYTGDLRDYYHVGVVESVFPVRIRHMAFGKMKMDTKLDKWIYHGKLKQVDYGAKEEIKLAVPKIPEKPKEETVTVAKKKLEEIYSLLGSILGRSE